MLDKKNIPRPKVKFRTILKVSWLIGFCSLIHVKKTLKINRDTNNKSILLPPNKYLDLLLFTKVNKIANIKRISKIYRKALVPKIEMGI